MDSVLIDLKKKIDEKEKALLDAIKNFKVFTEKLEVFRKRKRLTIMLRGKKRDGMKATETFDADYSEICHIRDVVYGELRALTNSVKKLSQIVDFIDKEYLDDAALFLSDTCYSEKKNAEIIEVYCKNLEKFREDLCALDNDGELEEQLYLCIRGLYVYTAICFENAKILDFAVERINFLRNKK